MWHRWGATARATAARAAVRAPTAGEHALTWGYGAARYASGPPRPRPEQHGAKNQGRRSGGGAAPARAVPSAKNWAREPSRPARAAPAARAPPRKAPAPRAPPRPKTQPLALPPVLSVFHLARMLDVHMRTLHRLTDRQAAASHGADRL